ncbi:MULTISPECIES: hypothetical protein [unclassified Lysinibacillus]|nr:MULTISPECIES: hypothetical protein [unclassified Lysinibacillus]MDM5249270.1 hypothetical protein [Lysinibacillus sp. G4S2]
MRISVTDETLEQATRLIGRASRNGNQPHVLVTCLKKVDFVKK